MAWSKGPSQLGAVVSAVNQPHTASEEAQGLDGVQDRSKSLKALSLRNVEQGP